MRFQQRLSSTRLALPDIGNGARNLWLDSSGENSFQATKAYFAQVRIPCGRENLRPELIVGVVFNHIRPHPA